MSFLLNCCHWPLPLGLLREDLYDDEYQPDIIEAIRRLPEHERNLRQYRIKRALDLSMKHAHLPKEQWTKPEEVWIWIYFSLTHCTYQVVLRLFWTMCYVYICVCNRLFCFHHFIVLLYGALQGPMILTYNNCHCT